MIEPDARITALRAGLVEAVRAGREAERDVFGALDRVVRDAPSPDGGWSAKDVQAHLSAWKRRQVERMAAIREDCEEPAVAETDEINAVFHAERADWPWERVVGDADRSTSDLIAEVEAASPATLGLDRVSGTVLGNGPEHTLTHLAGVAASAGLSSRVDDLADAIAEIVDRGAWPGRPAAYARYNLACFHALSGRLDTARELLRQALAHQEELRAFAPEDDDLITLRDEIPALIRG